jgi:hypothetical protein
VAAEGENRSWLHLNNFTRVAWLLGLTLAGALVLLRPAPAPAGGPATSCARNVKRAASTADQLCRCGQFFFDALGVQIQRVLADRKPRSEAICVCRCSIPDRRTPRRDRS